MDRLENSHQIAVPYERWKTCDHSPDDSDDSYYRGADAFFQFLMDHSHGIPPITDPLGAYWEQPDRAEIQLGVGTHNAFLTQNAFDRLKEYSTTIPTGVYPGKMWKSRRGDHWELCWYGEVQNNRCPIESRDIVIVPA